MDLKQIFTLLLHTPNVIVPNGTTNKNITLHKIPQAN